MKAAGIPSISTIIVFLGEKYLNLLHPLEGNALHLPVKHSYSPGVRTPGHEDGLVLQTG